MRPVRLDMSGFATFRNPTAVDFSDADYFALVGPTGAGKSTVIDAITFALYATVPRWDNKNMITPALAPSANRGVVRLIFDADGHRYAVVREVRRSGGTTSRVSMKASRLERLLDHNDLDGETELLGADSEVNSKVEELLGLSLDHFTTCVALPQGRFAEFLHAKASDRQQILSSLLGHEVYERLRGAAGDRGRAHEQRAKALSEALENYADATDDALKGLRARAEQLRQLRTWLSNTGLVELDAAAAAVAVAQQQLELLTEQHDALSAVAVPHDVAGIEADRAAAAAEVAAALKARRDAEAALQQARAALTAHRPRHELAELSRQWEQLNETQTALPELTQQAETAVTERASAVAAATEADEALTELRQVATASAAIAEKTASDLEAVEGDVVALGAIIAPVGIPALAADLAAAKADRDQAQQAIEKAEAVCAQARAAVMLPRNRPPLPQQPGTYARWPTPWYPTWTTGKSGRAAATNSHRRPRSCTPPSGRPRIPPRSSRLPGCPTRPEVSVPISSQASPVRCASRPSPQSPPDMTAAPSLTLRPRIARRSRPPRMRAPSTPGWPKTSRPSRPDAARRYDGPTRRVPSFMRYSPHSKRRRRAPFR